MILRAMVELTLRNGSTNILSGDAKISTDFKFQGGGCYKPVPDI